MRSTFEPYLILKSAIQPTYSTMAQTELTCGGPYYKRAMCVLKNSRKQYLESLFPFWLLALKRNLTLTPQPEVVGNIDYSKGSHHELNPGKTLNQM